MHHALLTKNLVCLSHKAGAVTTHPLLLHAMLRPRAMHLHMPHAQDANCCDPIQMHGCVLQPFALHAGRGRHRVVRQCGAHLTRGTLWHCCAADPGAVMGCLLSSCNYIMLLNNQRDVVERGWMAALFTFVRMRHCMAASRW